MSLEMTSESTVPAELPRYYQLEAPGEAMPAVKDLVVYLCGSDRCIRFSTHEAGRNFCAMRLWMTPTEADILSTVLAREDFVEDWFLAPVTPEG